MLKDHKVTHFIPTVAFLSMLAFSSSAFGEVHGLSTVEGLNITMFNKLPAAPKAQGDREFCDHLLIEPTTTGGKAAVGQGWGVTGELEIGQLTLVSFVGDFESGTSGSCTLLDGNVGFFHGSELVALTFANSESEAWIGSIQAFGDAGARIWDGDIVPAPFADITIDDTGLISIVQVVSEERFCGGQAIVPDIYSKPISEARALLTENGWIPTASQAPEGAGSYRAELVKAGLKEVTDCSGTGFGYCGFEYQSAYGTLSVTTVGDPELPTTPSVSRYDVSCQPAAH